MLKKYSLIFIFLFAGIGLFYSIKPKEERPRPLIVAFDSKIISADPRMIGSDPGSQYIEDLRFLPLISFDIHGSLINVLADKVQFEGTKLIIMLKKGIHFANGHEITAFDVERTYQAILTPNEGFPPSPRKGAFIDLDSIQIIGPQKIIFTLKKPDASFVNNLNIGILPKEAIATEPIGNLIGKNLESGPFVVTKITENEWYFAANQAFDYAQKPKLDAFVIKIIPDSSTRYAALIKGDVDLIQNSLDPDKTYLIETKMANEFQVMKSAKLATTYIGFNFRDPILRRKDVREALSYALDKESILKYRLRSTALAATGMFPEDSFYFHPALSSMPYQKETAMQLLKNSGLTLPIALKLTVSSSNKTNIEIAKTIAMTMRDIGFSIEVETLENSVFLQRINRGVAQMWLAPWVGFKDPDHLRFVFASTMVPPYGANRGHYSNLELDSLLEEGRVELNQSKRKEIYLKAQSLISKDIPYLYLWHTMNVAIASKRVHGFELYADGRYWSLINTTIDAQK